jgi:NADPH:quinone reductase-like Zn-dependent oxidoreductase
MKSCQRLTASSDPMMQHTGLLVTEWPAVLGSDYAGVVLEVGAECTKLKPGDHVYGCPAIGQNQFTPFQETFLVDENVAFKKSDNLSVEGTATIGAGLLVNAPE